MTVPARGAAGDGRGAAPVTFADPPAAAAWRHVDASDGFEVVFCERAGDGWRVRGHVAAVEEGVPWAVDYEIVVDAAWATRLARVTAHAEDGTAATRLDADADGAWTVDGAPAPAVAGCVDVDLEASAFTNAFPIHRLALARGAAAEAPAAYVRAPGLAVERLEQRYDEPRRRALPLRLARVRLRGRARLRRRGSDRRLPRDRRPRALIPMRRAIATVSLSGTLEAKLDAAARAGFDGVELFEDDLIASPLRPAEVRARAHDLGLGIDLYQPFRDFEAVPEPVLARNLRRAEAKLALMEALGASMVLVCSSVSPAARDDDDLAAEQLHALAERAAARGMRVAYEALAWGRHVHDYEHSWRIVQAAGHPALGVCLDSFHILSRGADPSGIRAIPAEKLFFLQLADAPAMDMNLLQWSRHHRCFPGQGSFDLAAFLGHVVAAGYGGPLSLEVFNDVFRQADAARTAVDGMRSLLVLEDALEPRLPAAPALGGHAFVELAGEPALAALGFTRTRRHRSKPVELWTQAGARVVLNHGEPGGPRVLAVAVESADPAASAERAPGAARPRDHAAARAGRGRPRDDRRARRERRLLLPHGRRGRLARRLRPGRAAPTPAPA